MAELLLPGDILSMTARAADRLMGAGNGDAALLYLWLLRRGGRLEPEAARRALKWDVPRLEAALSALVGLGLADGTAAPEAPARMEPEGPPEYTAADITRELEDGASSFPGLVNEVQRRLGKILSTSDLKSLYTLYDYLALPAEVICLLVSWCVEEFQRKYGPGRKPRMSQIQKEGFVWRRLGVDTAQAAEAHLKKQALYRSRGRFSACWISRPAPWWRRSGRRWRPGRTWALPTRCSAWPTKRRSTRSRRWTGTT